MTLEQVQAFRISAPMVDATDEALQHAGKSGYELFVLWTGSIKGNDFDGEHVYVPTQKSYSGEEGLHVRVGSDDLAVLNRWLYENRQVLAVQVHTHPSKAYHSSTDNSFPIVTTIGGLSVVVPHFGRDGVRSPGTVTYRLTSDGWVLLTGVARQILQLG